MLGGNNGVNMTKDDVIRMAREAGMHRSTHNLASNPVQHRYSYDGYEENLERFAALVAAAEREDILDTVNELMGSERERHPMFSEGHSYALESLQTFILARSNP